METIYFTTEEALCDNINTMLHFLEHINTLDITFLDGTYAEGVNCRGEKYAIHASGNGDYCNHKIEFDFM